MTNEPPERSPPVNRIGAAAPERENPDEDSAVRARFDRLLRSPHYEKLREGLIRVFARRGCSVPEELADETISRVVSKLSEICRSYTGEPKRYFYGVARNVFLEHLRRPQSLPYVDGMEVSAREEDPDLELTHHCLDLCVDELAPSERELIQDYYLYERTAKIDHRRELAARLGLGINALRIKAFRIRQRLQRCVEECLDRASST